MHWLLHSTYLITMEITIRLCVSLQTREGDQGWPDKVQQRGQYREGVWKIGSSIELKLLPYLLAH
eukprot:m.53615 g.53615  ORF g.53615 m.53615 type:complete len:65 (+) comp34264_c0_seq3:532-726(+)